MTAPNMELKDIHFDVIDPADSYHAGDTLEQCHSVGSAAFQAALPHRSADEIGAFMGTASDFVYYHRQPQLMTEDGLVNPKNRLWRPNLAIAFVRTKPLAREVVGFAYSADNVSGDTEQEQQRKTYMLVKRWRWLEKIAVHPDYQGRGIAQVLGYLTFRQAYPLQPASAYTWPEESPAGARLLSRWGLNDDGGRQPVRPYGPEGPEVVQHRHSARSARLVARRIAGQSNRPDIFNKMEKEFSGLGKFLSRLDRDTDEKLSRNPLGY